MTREPAAADRAGEYRSAQSRRSWARRSIMRRSRRRWTTRSTCICTATAGKLMLKGVAEAIRIKPGDPKTVYDWIRDAHEQGAQFWACPANLELFDKTEADLIPECSGLDGRRRHDPGHHGRRVSRADLLRRSMAIACRARIPRRISLRRREPGLVRAARRRHGARRLHARGPRS